MNEFVDVYGTELAGTRTNSGFPEGRVLRRPNILRRSSKAKSRPSATHAAAAAAAVPAVITSSCKSEDSTIPATSSSCKTENCTALAASDSRKSENGATSATAAACKSEHNSNSAAKSQCKFEAFHLEPPMDAATEAATIAAILEATLKNEGIVEEGWDDPPDLDELLEKLKPVPIKDYAPRFLKPPIVRFEDWKDPSDDYFRLIGYMGLLTALSAYRDVVQTPNGFE
ncbi:unnamed protein product, partial [Gongylonema pulchrum]|uniref:Uncharacterized protein n=1 Tax=Gongylonema pulchrum TaxID=637853 RepID=A0A183D7K8_9BILA